LYGKAGVGLVKNWFGRGKSDPQILMTKDQVLDFDVARVIAKFVSVGYCHDLDALAHWNCTRCKQIPGFIVTRIIDDLTWDVTGYVGYYPPWNAKMVVFRGTNGHDLKNWIENLKFNQHQVRLNLSFPGFEDLKVHNGFSRIWNIPFKENTMAAVQELVDLYGKDGPLYIAGHSAGGATAQLAAFAFKTLTDLPDIHLFTFGAPRVGNWAFAAKLSDMLTESWRFTHNRDIVPTVPWITMGFWHSAQEVFQYEQAVSLGSVYTTYRICDGSGEDPKGHNSMCPFGFGCRSVHDHYVYLNTIMENDGTC